MARRVGAWLEGTAADVSYVESLPGRPSVGAVIRGRGDGPRLVLNGHMDTVEALPAPSRRRLPASRRDRAGVHARGCPVAPRALPRACRRLRRECAGEARALPEGNGRRVRRGVVPLGGIPENGHEGDGRSRPTNHADAGLRRSACHQGRPRSPRRDDPLHLPSTRSVGRRSRCPAARPTTGSPPRSSSLPPPARTPACSPPPPCSSAGWQHSFEELPRRERWP